MNSRISTTKIFVATAAALACWSILMTVFEKWYLFSEYWTMTVTMILGSFIAGASAEGGGAIAFPVMTLLMKIPPDSARNFSLAIQSLGMTAASILIISRGFKVNTSYLLYASIGGSVGIVVGTYYILPLISPAYVKMLFVSFWLSFGCVLYFVNEIDKRQTVEQLPKFKWHEKASLIFIGVLGGSLSAMLGSGLDIFSFSYITMRYKLSEKVATPTSVIIMAINSIVGFFLHLIIIQDFAAIELSSWLVSIPVVIIGAPLGAYFIHQRTRVFISRFLYLIILAQFVTAFWIIQPAGNLLYFSLLCFGLGLIIFFGFSVLAKKFSIFK